MTRIGAEDGQACESESHRTALSHAASTGTCGWGALELELAQTEI